MAPDWAWPAAVINSLVRVGMCRDSRQAAISLSRSGALPENVDVQGAMDWMLTFNAAARRPGNTLDAAAAEADAGYWNFDIDGEELA